MKQKREKESETGNNQETNQEETIHEDGIKEEHVASSDPEEFIAQTEPMLRENDEQAYEEEAATTSHLSSEAKQETVMAHTTT